jgi:hypothetical protein
MPGCSASSVDEPLRDMITAHKCFLLCAIDMSQLLHQGVKIMEDRIL